jgi:RND family efflux transporter MFP subunit
MRRLMHGLVMVLGMAAAAHAAEPVQVTVSTLGDLAINPEQRAAASVVSLNDSQISAEVSARIIEIPVQVGATVEAGAVLAKLDAADYELARASAEAQIRQLEARQEFARAQLQRAQTLSRQQVVSEELLTQRESEVAVLEAQLSGAKIALAIAQRNLDKTLIRAPFKAVVVERLAFVGELAAPGRQLLHIVDAGQLEVSAKLQPEQLQLLRQASAPVLEADGKQYPLSLRTIVPVVSGRERIQEARLTFKGEVALPGSAGQLLLRQVQAHVPADVVLQRGEQLGIFILEGDQARFHPLPQAAAGRPARVDLPASTQVIMKGRFTLNDGDPVRVQ